MTNKTLCGRIAFVTGGDSGIGAACVDALAAACADVCIVYHDDEKAAAERSAAVEALGRRVLAVAADVSDEAAVDAAFDRCKKVLGRPNILVNSAGLNQSDVTVADMEFAQWQRLIATDLTGSFLTSRRFVRDLSEVAGQPAAIINITSIHAFVMRAGAADYDAAKAGQAALTRTLALEVADKGITVNAIAPGMILTPMNEEAMEDDAHRRALERNIPAKRAGRPEEVAHIALFLASPDAAYITGATIVVDGGLSLLLGQGA